MANSENEREGFRVDKVSFGGIAGGLMALAAMGTLAQLPVMQWGRALHGSGRRAPARSADLVSATLKI